MPEIGNSPQHAEATYVALPSQEHQQLARTLFARLLQPGTAAQEPTRRRADISEFALENAERTRWLHEVIDAFIAARLITVNQFIATSTLEISHEALIREWPRLASWLQEAREDIHLQQAISNDAREWERRGKPKDRLYHGSQLKEALAWQKRNTASGNEAAFLRASATHRSRLAVVGLVFGILTMIAWLIPIIGLPMGITGAILTTLGRRSVSRRTMATVGLVLSIIGLILTLLNAVAGAYLAGVRAPH